MTPTIAPNIVAAASWVRAAIESVYGEDMPPPIADPAFRRSAAYAVSYGLLGLWARRHELDQAGVSAMDSAAYYCLESNLGMVPLLDVASIRTAIALAADAASITGGPQVDPSFAPAVMPA